MSSALAAIDMGTNSFHMVIVEPTESGGFQMLTREKETVRLGSGAGDLETITPEAMKRAIDCLNRFNRIAKNRNASVRAVATSAVREARNRDEFLKQVKKETGLRVDVIQGNEEARLIYLGILQALPVFDERILLIDIGGGSTEYLIGQGGVPEFATSLKLGAIRLTDRFFPDGQVSVSGIEDARYFLRLNLLGLKAEMPENIPDTVIGSSGTARTLIELVQQHIRKGDGEARDMSAQELDEVVELLLDCKNRKQRESKLGLDEKRSDIIVAGALLLQESFRILGIKTMVYSPFALREGVVFDSFHRNSRSKDLSGIRKNSVLQLARRMVPQEGPAQVCSRLSLIILDSLAAAGVFYAEEVEREVLEYAALLHNCGIAIAHSAHHKHSHYIIQNSEMLLGFTGREIDVIAAIARYHRKALPSKKHSEYEDLNRYDRNLVKVLAGVLRISIGLSRGESGRVDDVKVKKQGKDLLFFIHPSQKLKPGDDLSLEEHGAVLRKDLLEQALERKIDIRISE